MSAFHFTDDLRTILIMGAQWLSSPACTELEAVMMDWAAQMLGLSSAFLNSSGIGGGVIMVLLRL
jgi:hypothetical protein